MVAQMTEGSDVRELSDFFGHAASRNGGYSSVAMANA
jgi:hypothetical protein